MYAKNVDLGRLTLKYLQETSISISICKKFDVLVYIVCLEQAYYCTQREDSNVTFTDDVTYYVI